MAKDTNTAEAPEEQAVPHPGFLTRKLEEAQAAKAEADKALFAAMEAKDVAALMGAMDKVKAADRDVAKAERAVRDAEFDRRTEERMARSVALKEAFGAVPFDYAEAYGAGIRTVTAKLQEDGTVLVDIGTVGRPPSEGRTPRVKSESKGTGTPRNRWQLDGAEYTSAELLTTFGGEEGEKAVHKAHNWREYGLTSNPGFDAALKKLAGRMGWDGGAERVLTHAPE